MPKRKIILYSPLHLEPWDWTNATTQGIGGSETAHIELSFLLGKKMFDTEIISIAPCERTCLGPGGAQWYPLSEVDNILKANKDAIWLVFRDSSFFDKKLSKKGRYYFISQDVDYTWTDERLSKVDKYICLCREHVKYTLQKYDFQLKGKVFQSTNGIRSDYIRQKIRENKAPRVPKRLIYSSSPDRGLELILDNFFRITEKHPDVKLDVYYGFNNLKVIAERNKDMRLLQLYQKLMRKSEELKEWVTFHGRINQNQLYKEMLTSSVWFYPSDWPETSCITCMEMQACGVYPILNNYWAQGENVLNGTVLDGVPQTDVLCKVSLFKELNNFLYQDTLVDPLRKTISEDALDSFDWNKVASQFIGWFNE